MWKLFNKKLPHNMLQLFTDHGATPKGRIIINTDHTKLFLPYQRTDYGQKFIIYSGVKLWNCTVSKLLANDPNVTKSIFIFKTVLKNYLLNN